MIATDATDASEGTCGMPASRLVLQVRGLISVCTSFAARV